MPKALNDIVVIGGSHAGLFSAIALQNAGFRVRMFERAPEILRGTGAGIRVQPLLANILRREAGIDLDQFATRTRFDRHLAPRREAAQNRIVFEQAEDGNFASWGSLYRALLGRFGAENYFCGESCVSTAEVDGKVEVRFAGGRTDVAGLVVFADGIGSTGRSQLNPSARLQYAGYVAWRGLVAEAELSAETRALLAEARIFVVVGLCHVILYPVPGEAGLGAAGARLINAIWDRNVAAVLPLVFSGAIGGWPVWRKLEAPLRGLQSAMIRRSRLHLNFWGAGLSLRSYQRADRGKSDATKGKIPGKTAVLA